jgi:transcriptional regulator with XRE-family HTH domain
MKFSEWIYNYRAGHALTMQAMADLCGLSKQYISVLEKGINPNTKKPFAPSVETIKKISRATNTDINLLFSLLDNQEIVINAVEPFPKFDAEFIEITDTEQALLNDFRKLNAAGKERACAAVSDLTEISKYTKTEENEK